MTFTTERINGARFVKVNGITRFIWFSRGPGRSTAVKRHNGILMIALLGHVVVLAPYASGAR